jgi:predicted Zn-dependent protease
MMEERWTLAARDLRSAADFWSVRFVDERADDHSVRNDVALPARQVRERGAMVTAWAGAGAGYAATADLSAAGCSARWRSPRPARRRARRMR